MKKLSIEDKALVKGFLDAYEVDASELSFTNLFIWRNKYNFYYEFVGDFLWIINVKNDESIYFSQPIGDYNDLSALKASIKAMQDRYGVMVLKKCDERFLKVLDSLDLSYDASEVRDDFDYLYDFEEMKNLRGNKFHKKKNHINKFLKTYDQWAYKPIDGNFEDVLQICEIWFHEAIINQDEALLQEYQAIKDLLDNYDRLNCFGGILYVENRPSAFIIGESLNEETLVIHIEKGDKAYHGIYNMMFYTFLNEISQVYKYVNREQDMGIPGLRKSKLSYHPVGFVKKMNIKLTP